MDPEYSLRVHKVAAEIFRYLCGRPKAADSLEGIAAWWLSQQRLTEDVNMVQDALDELLEQGKISKRTNPFGSDLYYLHETTNSEESK